MGGGVNISGTVKQGMLQAGDKVVLLPAGEQCTIRSTFPLGLKRRQNVLLYPNTFILL